MSRYSFQGCKVPVDMIVGVDDKEIRPSLTTSKEGLKTITYNWKQQRFSAGFGSSIKPYLKILAKNAEGIYLLIDP